MTAVTDFSAFENNRVTIAQNKHDFLILTDLYSHFSSFSPVTFKPDKINAKAISRQ